MAIFIIIPARDEAKVIGEVAREARRFYENVIVVDDGSTDKTSEEAREAGAYVLRHLINRGQGAALRTGIKYALTEGADIIVTFDADGQFEAREIEEIVRPIEAGECDVVLGSRFLKDNKIPALKKFILYGGIFLTKILTGLKITDTHNGFRAMSRKAAEQMVIRYDRMAHSSEILNEIAKLKLKYKEIPVTVHYTAYSKNKGQKLAGVFRILFDLIFR